MLVLDAALDAAERDRLTDLLLSGEPVGALPDGARHVVVVPRPGTISPWSSKATDIARACGFDAVERIERGVTYAIEASEELSADDRHALSKILFDRMTEAVLDNEAAASVLFEHQPPVPVGVVPLGEDGLAALRAAKDEDPHLRRALGVQGGQYDVDAW